ncbi:MAG: phosphohistidine phosphatase SixA [Candidatus Brocadiales bacterium]|nr:phosphohistidine phosphatase SixA [Candidatus Bathyanammoxibius sp.]MCQ4573629.1 phosphohistidine phosphatase SixA [Candidatus Bathyanammoxibius amoris]
MEVYLVRHAEAKRPEEDPGQPLSERGREAASKVAGLLKGLDIKVKVIKHSGKLRAEETARELSKAVTSSDGLEKTEGLAPNDDIVPMKTLLEKTGGNVMIVGHLPYLSRLASSLLGTDPDKNIVNFQTASIIRLDRDHSPGSWRIRWMLTPDITET